MPPAREKISTLSSIRSRSSGALVGDDEQPTSIASSSGGMKMPPVPEDPYVAEITTSRTPWKAISLTVAAGVLAAVVILVAGRSMRNDGSELRDLTPPLPPATVAADPPEVTTPVVAHAPPSAPVEAAPSAPDPSEIATPEVVENESPTRMRGRRARTTRSTSAPTTAMSSPAPTASAAAPAREPGTLSLMAIPSASVRIDGRDRGNTPLINLSLPAGEHRVELRSEDGRSKTITVRIESGRPTRQRVEL
jgi:hypothetical protein